MTSGSARVLVLGLGNLLLEDDAVGLRLLERLALTPHPEAEYVDGGTQGLALLGLLEGREGVLILDAVGLGSPPGTVHTLFNEEIAQLRAGRANSAHEGNALGLLQTATLLGELPPLAVVGIEPAQMHTNIGLSPAVEAALPAAVEAAQRVLTRFSAP